jgi:hypothetical protein
MTSESAPKHLRVHRHLPSSRSPAASVPSVLPMETKLRRVGECPPPTTSSRCRGLLEVSALGRQPKHLSGRSGFPFARTNLSSRILFTRPQGANRLISRSSLLDLGVSGGHLAASWKSIVTVDRYWPCLIISAVLKTPPIDGSPWRAKLRRGRSIVSTIRIVHGRMT